MDFYRLPQRDSRLLGGPVRLVRTTLLFVSALAICVSMAPILEAQFLANHADRTIRESLHSVAADVESPKKQTPAPRKRADSPAVKKSARGPDVVDLRSYEWMQVGRVTPPPTAHTTEATRVDNDLARQDVLEILDMRLQFNERPAYVGEGYHQFIDARPRKRSRRMRAFRRLAHKPFYRHLRRLLKKQWRKDFRESAWSFDEYADGLTQINRLGREGDHDNEINAEYFYNTARNDTLSDEDLEGESEAVIVRYGPVGLTDEGQIDFDFRSMLDSRAEDMDFEIDPEESAEDALTRRVGSAVDPVFRGKCVKVRPRMKLRVDPFRALGGNPQRVLRSYGGSLDLSFYSDITKRKLFSIEAEAKVRRDESGCFVNFVIEGWR